MQKDPKIIDEAYEFFVKILIPSILAISVKVAVQIKNEGLNYTRAFISFIAGIGCAYFFYPIIEESANKTYIPLLVGITAISGEKIAEWLVYKFKVDIFLGALADFVVDRFRSKK